ncbi:MAG: hypothetical protein ACI9BF_000002 [Candidatus Paceibacteria bacterium]|jgi:hypothetical protein
MSQIFYVNTCNKYATVLQLISNKVKQKQDFYTALGIRSSPQLQQFTKYCVVLLLAQVATSSKLAIMSK